MPSSRHPLLGALLCLVVAFSFATNTALSSVAYAEGANALSVLTYRTALAALALFLVLRAVRVPVTLPPAKRKAALGLGVLMGVYSYGLLGAVEHMPVALAVLTFYLFPLFVGLVSWSMGWERMTPRLAGALVAAFVGLMLALDVGGGSLSVAGVALALMGALIITALLLLNNRLVGGGQDSRPVSLHMLATATLIYLAVDVAVGSFALPETPKGWAAFGAVGVFYTFSIIGIFVAVSWIGPVRSSLFMNFEPVSSVFWGTVLLGQPMKPTQLLGAALVVAAIVATAWKKAGGT